VLGRERYSLSPGTQNVASVGGQVAGVLVQSDRERFSIGVNGQIVNGASVAASLRYQVRLRRVGTPLWEWPDLIEIDVAHASA
jgi:hypothetical protein